MTRRRNRKNNNRIISILIVLVILAFLVPAMTSFSKYVYNSIHDYYLGTQGFYFNSDKLSSNHSEIEIANNWSGAESYKMTVNLNSKKNDLVFAESDIEYEISFTHSDNIKCTLSKTSGIIKGSANAGINEDYFDIIIEPVDEVGLPNGAQAWVDVTVTSTSPYTAVLSGKLYVGVGTEDITYEIMDSPNSPYLEVNITNSLNIGEDVTLTFNPNVVLLDMTSRFRLNSTGITTQEINQYQYVNTVTSYVGSLETTTVKFYKIDPSQDYTYQAGDDVSNAVVKATY